MQAKRIMVNTHIEKTAGTSLLRFFEQTVGKNRIAFYDPITDSLIKVSDLFVSPSNDFIDKHQLKSYAFWPILKQFYFIVQSKNRRSSSLPESIAIVHGHFAANRFDSLLKDPIRSVVIRDPLKRMRSQYDHWKRAKGRNQWRIMVPYNSQMSFEEYALLPVMQNYQTKALAGKDLASFDVVGVTERMDAFTNVLFDMLVKEGHIQKSIHMDSVKKLNPHKKIHETTIEFEKKFKIFHKEDYQLYKQALSLAK
ncbi:MAG: hypothetical protein ACREHC_01410 [Candidatus Levyibacteriota bacterium]